MLVALNQIHASSRWSIPNFDKKILINIVVLVLSPICMALLNGSGMRLERIKSTVFVTLLFNRDFPRVISRRIQHRITNKFVLKPLPLG